MVEPSAFEVGLTLAVTPGAVVHRTPMYELIQYAPRTDQVRTVPLLIVPPVINKYYAIDLAPGRSLIEYLVAQGQQVFVISWRNPDARHRAWGIDAYGQAIRDALDAVLQIGEVPQTHLLALCSGGVIASMLAAYLAEAGGIDQVATLGLAVTVLDQSRAGTAGALVDERVAPDGRRRLRSRAATSTGALWPRCSPGCDPTTSSGTTGSTTTCKESHRPPSTSCTGMPTPPGWQPALHGDFIGLAMTNALVHPGEASMLGQPVDLSRVKVDSYVVAGVADHLCPWQACYATTQLLGRPHTFRVVQLGPHRRSGQSPHQPQSIIPDVGRQRPRADRTSG